MTYLPGTVLKFAKPNADELDDQFEVIENRGDRVLVRPLGFESWRIQPTAVYVMAELVPA